MPPSEQMHRPRFGRTPRGPASDADHRLGPFPVTVVRAGTVSLPPLTVTQHVRQTRANRMAHDICDASREGTRPLLDVDVRLPAEAIAGLDEVVRNAPALAVRPPAGAVRVGRTRRGDVVVAVLHAADWSLLLCPGRSHPRAWVFLDTCHGLPIAVEAGTGPSAVRCTDMLDAVFAALTR